MDADEARKLVTRYANRWNDQEAIIADAKDEQLRLVAELRGKGVSNYAIAKHWSWRVSETTVATWVSKGRALMEDTD